jgi:hypothetical protein
LSALGVWLLVINGIIGAGIFGMPAVAARLAGGFSPWVFVICAAAMLPVMLSFAELASHFDGTGGPVRYAGSVFGPFAASGWMGILCRAPNQCFTNVRCWSAPSGISGRPRINPVCDSRSVRGVRRPDDDYVIGTRDAIRSLAC